MPKKKDREKYSIPSGDTYKELSEQLGLPIYSYTEATPSTLELPISEHPDISFLSDIDASQGKAYIVH